MLVLKVARLVPGDDIEEDSRQLSNITECVSTTTTMLWQAKESVSYLPGCSGQVVIRVSGVKR